MAIVSSAIAKFGGGAKFCGSRCLLGINSLLEPKFEKLSLSATGGGGFEPTPPSAENVRFFASKNVLKSEIPGPKKPPNAYSLFWKDQMPKFSGKVQERVKKISTNWKQLPAVEKQPYEEKSKKLFEAYHKAIKQMPPQMLQERTRMKAERKLSLNNRRLLTAKRKIRRDFGAPKKPLNSFALFQATLDRAKMGMLEFVKHSATKWNALPEAEKQRYATEAKRALDSYKLQLAEWEKKMRAQNREKELDVLHTGPKQKIATLAKKPKKMAAKKIGRKKLAKSSKLAKGASKVSKAKRVGVKAKSGRKSGATLNKKPTAKKISAKAKKVATA